MRFLIIRHGDPDYSIDSLTEKGKKEAELLSEKLKNEKICKIYCSPLGRAKRTADPTAEKIGMEPEILEWLREFPASIRPPYSPDKNTCPWNMPPQYWTEQPDFYDRNKWRENEIYINSDVPGVYDRIAKGIDTLLLDHGFVREGRYFTMKDDFEDSDCAVAMFCHLGLGLALLSYLMSIPLPLMWHSFFMPTSSVTTVLMEKHNVNKRQAIARCVSIGDTSHLYAKGEAVSSSGLHSPIYF